MLHEELENFTYDELENFTYEELELGVPELLEKVRDDNRPLPMSVVEKLTALCKALESESELPSEITAITTEGIKKFNFTGAIQYATSVLRFLNEAHKLVENYESLIKDVIKTIWDFFT